MSKKAKSISDRQAVVAGRFYPSSPIELKKELDKLFEKAGKQRTINVKSDEEIRAIVSPHAGYIFSGTVSASAFLPLKGNKNIKRIFLIGSSHNAWFDKASIYYSGSYVTPLGKLKVDTEIAKSLLKDSEVFTYLAEAHLPEHSLEVQLPFLQYLLGNKFTIIPILLGAHSRETPKLVAQHLEKFFQPGNLIVISTDLSHYPAYNDAVKVDKQTIDALCSNEPDSFLERLKNNEKQAILNLSTSMCGWTSALTLMYLTEKKENIRYVPVLYQNSGDIPLYGDKSRVVGYQSVLILQKSEEAMKFHLTEEEEMSLLEIARASIYENLNFSDPTFAKKSKISQALKKATGVFISVYCDSELRGCIGRIESSIPLYESVKELAVNAAFHDARFRSVTLEEIKDTRIEISVLTPLKRISSIEEIIPGKHGILIRNHGRSGTYLPQVATKTGWNAQQMVEHCAREKAGLNGDDLKDADIFTYEALIFSDMH